MKGVSDAAAVLAGLGIAGAVAYELVARSGGAAGTGVMLAAAAPALSGAADLVRAITAAGPFRRRWPG